MSFYNIALHAINTVNRLYFNNWSIHCENPLNERPKIDIRLTMEIPNPFTWFVLKAGRKRPTLFRPQYANLGWKKAMWGGVMKKSISMPKICIKSFFQLVSARNYYY